jgi:hypothetical protein
VLRVTARIVKSEDGSKALTTAPPCLPVAPMMSTAFDMIESCIVQPRKSVSYEMKARGTVEEKLFVISSAGVFRPTVVGKSWPIESIGSRLRDYSTSPDKYMH